MHFKVKAVSEQDFGSWIAKVQQSPSKLRNADSESVAKQNVIIAGKAQYFTDVQPGLLVQVIQNVRDGKLRYRTPMFLTENMLSDEFKKHAN